VDIEQLYREHSVSLFRYTLRLTGDADRAADIVQTAFMRLVERPPREQRIRSWLFRVATNTAFDQSRAQRRHTRLLHALPSGASTGDAPRDPAQTAAQNDEQRRVRAALERLSKRDRTVLLMRAEGFAHREIAAAVGSSTSSIGVTILRALKKLERELLGDSVT
jgi:RNA polymerase sigma-70 factor (ECF subfamily)